MIQYQRNSMRLSYSPVLFCYLAILLLIVPFRLLIAAIMSAAVHELFHILAIRLMHVPMNAIHIGVRGAEISTQSMTEKQELFCALAGPVGGLLLLPLYRWIPAISLCAFVQSLYNLLPLYPTDGGRVFRCCANLLLSKKDARRLVFLTEALTVSAILAICIYGSFWLHLGIIPLIFGVSVLLRFARNK